MAHLRVFGCLAYALVPKQHRRKSDDKAIECIFVGYSAKSKGYHLYDPQSKCILVSQDVVFVEDAIQPLLSCTRDVTQDVYETLLPLFGSAGQSHVAPTNEANIQPMQVSIMSLQISPFLM